MGRKGPKPGEWRYTVGEVPHQLTAYERKDRDLAIYTRVWDGSRYTRKRRLRDSIRTDDGRIDPDLEIEVQEAALERQRALAAGLDPDEGDVGPMTLERGFRKLLHRKDGKYASDTRWRRDMKRNRDVILGVLDGDLLWSQIRHAHYRKLWRALAEENRRSGRYGARAAEVIVGALQTAALWLQQEDLIEPGDGQPAHGWRRALKDEWAEITNNPVGKPARPRYTVDEQRRIWAALAHPEVDPRVALAVEIGAELRLGQVLRCRRTDVFSAGGFRIGGVHVHGRGKKPGESVTFTMGQRHAVTRAMTSGYLADLERAYQAGEVEDYYLVPGGYLHTVTDRKGRPVRRAQLRYADRPLSRTGIRKQWRDLERIAGVEHVEGRGWYGLRRLHSDLAEDVEDDQRVLNRLGGWTDTKTRQLYQQEGRSEIEEAAKRTRAKIRPKRPKGNGDNDVDGDEREGGE